MTQQPALVAGQVWGGSHTFYRLVVRPTSEVIEYRSVKQWPDTRPSYGPLRACSWTAWRDWQQRHDARPVESSDD